MLSLREKFLFGDKVIPILKKYWKSAAAASVSFILCRFTLGDSFHPLSLACLSAAGAELFPFSLLGSVLGTFTFLLGKNSLRYLAAILLFTAFRYAFYMFFKRTSPTAEAVMAAVSLLLTALAFVLSDFSPFYLFIYIAEALIAFACSLIFRKSRECIKSSAPPNAASLLSLFFSLSLVYISLFDVRILGISPLRILAAVTVCCACFYLRPDFLLAIGIIFGICGFIKGDIASLLIFPSGALACLAFIPAGKIFSGAAFFVVALFMLLLNGIDKASVIMLAEIFSAIVTALLIPEKFFAGLSVLKKDSFGIILKNASAYRLDKASKALKEIGELTERVSGEVEKLKCEPMESYVQNSVNRVCRKCKNSPTCWQRYYDRSIEEVRKLFIDGKNGLPLDMDSFRKMTDCIKCGLMEDVITEQSKKYSDFLRSKSYSQNIRYIMCDQFFGMSDLLLSLSRELSSVIPLDEKEEKSCREILEAAGAIEENGFAKKDIRGNFFLSFLFENSSLRKISLRDLTFCLSEALKSPLSLPLREECQEGFTRLSWQTQPPFICEADYFQRASEDKSLCGDSAQISSDICGNPTYFLSDGMGVGTDAAIDSTMTTSLLSRLIASGASFPAALKLVSSSLLSLKEERLCTVDFLHPDLFNCTLSFYKAGAAPSYLLREGKCFKIGKSALPAGILGGAEAAKSVFSLKDGDMVLMVTDGITETGEDWLLTSLAPLYELRPLEICKKVVELAQARSVTGRCDDMTALAVKFNLR